jgi:GNAT superfamily N-acetyltransferase
VRRPQRPGSLDQGDDAAAGAEDYLKAIPRLSLVLVAEDKDGDIVGAAYALPPMPIMNGAHEQGFPPAELMSIPLAVAKLAGLSVTEKARGAGWATHLLKRTVQIYEQLDLLLLYWTASTSSAASRLSRRRRSWIWSPSVRRSGSIPGPESSSSSAGSADRAAARARPVRCRTNETVRVCAVGQAGEAVVSVRECKHPTYGVARRRRQQSRRPCERCSSG